MQSVTNSKKYVKMDPIEHVLLRSDMYVGSNKAQKINEFVCIKEEDIYKILRKEISVSPAILRIFIEILSNATDNVERSRAAGIPCSYIKVSINKETGETSVINDGDIIPIEINPVEKVYNHSLIFGQLLTGSNYDDEEERLISGRNGLGATCCNIFSSKFTVKGVDPNNKLTFEQTWTNNMKETTKPIIGKTKLSRGYTSVSYFPDFKQFGLSGYTDDIISIYLKYVVDVAMLSKVKVYFNDELIPVNNLQTYAKLYDCDTDENLFLKHGNSEVLVTPSKEFQIISFVNGIYTKLGGQHVDSWSEAIFRPLVDKFNKKGQPNLNIKDIKQFFRIFVVSYVVNPEFDSQSKCVDPETNVLLWNGSMKRAKDIQIDDVIIADDGLPSKVKNICKGEDTMYSIFQNKGITYKVNSKHTLTLKCPSHKNLKWHNKSKTWVVGWFDIENFNYRLKRFKVIDNEKKDELYNLAEQFRNKIDDNNIFDIDILTYMKLNQKSKEVLYGFKCEAIHWEYQSILIDPYILGMWLGDGHKTGSAFSSEDDILIEAYRKWGIKNDIEVVKYTDKYSYGLICHSGKVKNINHKYIVNPLKYNLSKYNLLSEKHIPKEYLLNSREVRLQLLAGIADTDGYITDDGTCLIITQGMNHTVLVKDMIYLIKSLGFSCMHSIINTTWVEYKTKIRKNGKAHKLRICGKLEDIPVLLERKKGRSPARNVTTSNIINIRKDGLGTYVGFELDRRNRFLLEDFTVTHNCKLENPKVPAVVKTSDIAKILKWSVIEEIEDIIKSKEILTLKKSEKKKKGYVKIEGLDPANKAGTKDSHLCSLILCEGLSAKTYAVAGIEKGIDGVCGRDFYGVLCLKGKVLNVRNSSMESIAKNKVITDLIQALNLQHGVDYLDENNFKNLSYGKVVLLTDSDVDGKHISSLIMNLFHSLFPSLLKRKAPFVISMQTPIVRVFRKDGDLLFYDENKFKEFSRNQTSKIKCKYYKGLGTTKSEDVKDTFGEKMVDYINDNDCDKSFNKVFHVKCADQRKEWLEKYDPNKSSFSLDESGKCSSMNITDFLNNEMIKFSHDDCKRSIPNLFDGLKQSQRKVLYSVKKRNLTYNKTSLKVAQLAGYVAEVSNYHHGEGNLFQTITKMANEFPGSNNIPILYRDGQFGSRSHNGNDAANARYIFTKMEPLTPFLFREEDDVLLEKVYDDGDEVEPLFYVPIIPMVLVNGAVGIGSGWSSSVPSYNPLDLIECIEIWLKRDGNIIVTDPTDNSVISYLPDLVPWYRGFNGTVEKIKDKNDTTFITHGIIDKDKNKCVISEIPIGMSTDKFKEMCEDWMVDKKIKNFQNYSTPNQAYFVITESDDGFSCNLKNMKLHSYLYTSNMVLFNEKEQLKKYTIEEIINEFCIMRYHLYKKRKSHMISIMEKELRHLFNKARFVEEVISKKLNIMNVEETVIVANLEKSGYDKENEKKNDDDDESGSGGYNYLLKMQVRTFTSNKVKQLRSEIEDKNNKLHKLKSTSEKQLWLNDLQEFKNEYSKWLKIMEIPSLKLKTKNNKKNKA